jgi:hypothetical protein
MGIENSIHKNTATFSKLIIAAYDFVVHLYISRTYVSGRLGYDSLFLGIGVCSEGPWAKNLALSRWMITGMGSMFSV